MKRSDAEIAEKAREDLCDLRVSAFLTFTLREPKHFTHALLS